MRDQLYINGSWQPADNSRTFDVYDPSNESVIQQVAAASPEDIDKAVQAARVAFDEGVWPT